MSVGTGVACGADRFLAPTRALCFPVGHDICARTKKGQGFSITTGCTISWGFGTQLSRFFRLAGLEIFLDSATINSPVCFQQEPEQDKKEQAGPENGGKSAGADGKLR